MFYVVYVILRHVLRFVFLPRCHVLHVFYFYIFHSPFCFKKRVPCAGQPRINAGSRFPGCAAQPPLGTKLSQSFPSNRLQRTSVSIVSIYRFLEPVLLDACPILHVCRYSGRKFGICEARSELFGQLTLWKIWRVHDHVQNHGLCRNWKHRRKGGDK